MGIEPENLNWDPDQELIVSAGSDDRLLIKAGPGTGKTAVACGRVAFLIDECDCEPSRVWLISFTRTAVTELRNRIAAYVDSPADAYAVRIATLDSHAWTLHSGFESNAVMAGDYDSNIQKLTKQIRENTELQEYIKSIDHIVIDEAQDIVGVRANLIEALIDATRKECGMTIFGDQAQAIYGFTSDNDSVQTSEYTLFDRIEGGGRSEDFDVLDLNKIFRTDDPALVSLFGQVRSLVCGSCADSGSRLSEVTNAVRTLAAGTIEENLGEELRGREDVLILYRKRGEALRAASYLRAQEIPHRLRMSGLPISLHPWIGMCLSDFQDSTISKETLVEKWSNHVRKDLPGLDLETAWEKLVRMAGRTVSSVDLVRLKTILGRARPPADFTFPELGVEGPVIGTIHASKGREAAVVHLMVPPNPQGQSGDLDEEARIVFVGATRAKSRLLVGSGSRQNFRRLASGRVFIPLRKKNVPRAQVEIGREGDMTAEGVAGRSCFHTREDVEAAQSALRELQLPAQAWARADRNNGFRYGVYVNAKAAPLAFLAQAVNSELFEVAKALGGWNRPPDGINHLSIVALRTIVLSPDVPEHERLHLPWSDTGIVVAPVIIGLPALWFPYRRK